MLIFKIIFTRQLSERMSLGSLIFQGFNCEFWVILACVTNDYALKQHALIRGLQLDISLALSWAYLGKVMVVFFSLNQKLGGVMSRLLCFTALHKTKRT